MAGLDGVKTWWRNLSTRDKWLVGGGGLVVALLMLGEAGGAGQQINSDAGRMFAGNGQGYENPYAQQGGGFFNGGGQSDNGGGYYDGGQGSNGGFGQQAGYGGGGDTGGGSSDSDPTGYWARQRSQEQSAQNFDNYIRDQNVVRDNETGTVYSGVTNDVGDAAIASGGYSQVPTAELPTSSDTSSSSGE